MRFKSRDNFVVSGRGHVFIVTLPEVGKPVDLLGTQVIIDGTAFICTGLESRGPARPGMEVGMVVRPLSGKINGQLF